VLEQILELAVDVAQNVHRGAQLQQIRLLEKNLSRYLAQISDLELGQLNLQKIPVSLQGFLSENQLLSTHLLVCAPVFQKLQNHRIHV